MGVQVPDGGPVRVFNSTVFPGAKTQVIETLNASDEARILDEIRNAKGRADIVIVSSHSHEPNDETVPPSWMEGWARRCLDAGASAFIIHGSHQLRGIEIHDGKPIFYSLGNFVFQLEAISRMPADQYEQYGLGNANVAADLQAARAKAAALSRSTLISLFESVVAVPTFKGDRLVALRLYPIELGLERPAEQRGVPRLAGEATGREIIERLRDLSAPFGTDIVYENGTGVWKPEARR